MEKPLLSIYSSYNEQTENIHRLPLDVFREIALNLPYTSILAFCRAHPRFAGVCRDNYFWNIKITNDFGEITILTDDNALNYLRKSLDVPINPRDYRPVVIKSSKGFLYTNYFNGDVIDPFVERWNTSSPREKYSYLLFIFKLICGPGTPVSHGRCLTRALETSIFPSQSRKNLTDLGRDIVRYLPIFGLEDYQNLHRDAFNKLIYDKEFINIITIGHRSDIVDWLAKNIPNYFLSKIIDFYLYAAQNGDLPIIEYINRIIENRGIMASIVQSIYGPHADAMIVAGRSNQIGILNYLGPKLLSHNGNRLTILYSCLYKTFISYDGYIPPRGQIVSLIPTATWYRDHGVDIDTIALATTASIRDQRLEDWLLDQNINPIIFAAAAVIYDRRERLHDYLDRNYDLTDVIILAIDLIQDIPSDTRGNDDRYIFATLEQGLGHLDNFATQNNREIDWTKVQSSLVNLENVDVADVVATTILPFVNR